MSHPSVEWFRLAFSYPVVVRASMCAAIVGSILIVINHCDCIAQGHFGMGCLAKSALMPVVPYVVSTISSVHAIRQAQLGQGLSDGTAKER